MYKMAEYTTDGNVWAVDQQGHALRFVDDQMWLIDDDSLNFSCVAAGGEQLVYGIAGQALYQLVFPNPQPIADPRISTSLTDKIFSLSIGSDGTMWGLDSRQQMWLFNPDTGQWEQKYWPIPATLQVISVVSAAILWGVQHPVATSELTKFDNGWIPYDIEAVFVSAAPDGTVWYISPDGKVHVAEVTGSKPEIGERPGTMTTVSANAAGVAYGYSDGSGETGKGVYFWDPGSDSWIPVGQSFADYTAPSITHDAANVFVVDTSNQVVLRYEGGDSWTQIPLGGASVASLAGVNGNEFWAASGDGKVYHWKGLYWKQIDGPDGATLASVSVAEDGTLAGIDTKGIGWWNIGYGWFSIGFSIDNAFDSASLTQISSGNAQSVFALSSANKIYSLTTQTHRWAGPYAAPLQPPKAIAVSKSGVLHALLSDGQTIMHYDSHSNTWESSAFITMGLVQFTAHDDYHLCGTTATIDGQNWLWYGNDAENVTPPPDSSNKKMVPRKVGLGGPGLPIRSV